MVPAGNKAKRLSSVNNTIKTIYHHHPYCTAGITCSKLKVKALKQGMKYVNNKDTITTSAVNFEHIITGRDCPI